jgi:type II secretory pathway pseudopilin PulG
MRRDGFAIAELLMVIACLAVVVGLLLPALSRSIGVRRRVSCVDNLKQIGIGMRTFAVDFNGESPWTVAMTNGGLGPLEKPVSSDLLRIFASISNELSTPKIVTCPYDNRQRLKTNSWAYAVTYPAAGNLALSYFIGLTANEEAPESVLGGDRNLTSGVPSVLNWRTVTPSTPAWRFGDTAAIRSLAFDPKSIHKVGGNLMLGDGSVQQVSSKRLRDTAETASKTNRLEWLMPVDH